MAWHVEYPLPEAASAALPEPETSKREGSRALERLARACSRFLPSTLFVAGFLLFWQFAIPKGVIPGIPAQFLSTPANAVEQFRALMDSGYVGIPLWEHFWASLRRTLYGVSLATLVGVPFGLAMGLSRSLDRTVGPVVGFLRPIPALAWIPVVVIWLGIDEESKIFVIFMTSVLFVITGARLGAQAVPHDYYLVARNYGLRGWRLLRHVVLPPALPQILAGLRTALTIGWAVVVAAELIGAASGLGFMIRNASDQFDVDTVYVGIFLIGVVGVAFEYGLRYVEKRLLHWQGAR